MAAGLATEFGLSAFYFFRIDAIFLAAFLANDNHQ